MGQCIVPKDEKEKKREKEEGRLSAVDKATILAKKVREAPVLDLDSNTLLRRRGISRGTITTKGSEGKTHQSGVKLDRAALPS